MNRDTELLYGEESQSKDFIPLTMGAAAPPVPPQPDIVHPPHPMGPSNTVTLCHYCKATVKTSIKHTTTTRTHKIALMFSLFCCCCCIPYCMDSTRNTDHYCPLCDRYLGTYEK